MKIRSLVASAILTAACACAWAQPITLKFAHVSQPTHPLTVGAQKFAELLAKSSEGRIRVQELGGGTLGSEAQILSAVQGGFIDVTVTATPTLSAVVKDFSLLDIPFTFTKAEQVDALMAGPFGEQLMAKLQPKNLIGLGIMETGFRNVTNSRRPIATVDDLRGLKLRVMPSPLFIETFSTLKTNPVPMAFTELYAALESRAMDAQENPYSAILAGRFYEVQKYLSVTSHIYTANVVLIGKKSWDRLSGADRKLVQDAAAEASAFQRKYSRENAAADRKALESKMQVNDVPPEVLAKMRETTRHVADKFVDSHDKSIVQIYRSEIERVRTLQH
ncbi:TRAP transporter substrate-binding protein [Xylophilus sp. GW821-FHT01B05]